MEIKLDNGAVISNIPLEAQTKILGALVESTYVEDKPEKERKKYKQREPKDKLDVVKDPDGKGGRARLSEFEKQNIVRCWQAGDVIRTICKKFNVSPATVSRLTQGMDRAGATEAVDNMEEDEPAE